MNNQDVIAGQDANVVKGNDNSVVSNSNNTINNNVTNFISIYSDPDVNKGLTTRDVMSICDFMVNKALAEFNSANEKAIARNKEFAQIFIPRLEKIENYVNHISDPKFQFLCRDAMTSAAKTDSVDDYKLLAELLSCHVEKGVNDKKIDSAISHAIRIIDEVDNDALCALTVCHSINLTIFPEREMKNRLKILDNLYGKVSYLELPCGNNWIEHLDMLKAVRIDSIQSFSKISEFYPDAMSGYCCVGIENNSEQYKEAVKELTSAGLNESFLVENELLDGFVRLPVVNKNQILNISVKSPEAFRKVNDVEINALNKVWDMYSHDQSQINKVKNRFMEIWDGFSNLKRVRTWWDSLQMCFDVTPLGRVLAQINAKRCVSNFPDLI